MNRRRFLGALSALPLLGFLKPEPKPDCKRQGHDWIFENHAYFCAVCGEERDFYDVLFWDADGEVFVLDDARCAALKEHIGPSYVRWQELPGGGVSGKDITWVRKNSAT